MLSRGKDGGETLYTPKPRAELDDGGSECCVMRREGVVRDTENRRDAWDTNSHRWPLSDGGQSQTFPLNCSGMAKA